MNYQWKPSLGWSPLRTATGKTVGQINERQRTVELGVNCSDIECVRICEAFPEWRIRRAGESAVFVPETAADGEEKHTSRKRPQVIAWDMDKDETRVFQSKAAAMRFYGIEKRETIDRLIDTGRKMVKRQVWFDELFEL